MRRWQRWLWLTTLLAAASPLVALSDSAPDQVEHNRRRLEKIRTDPDRYALLVHDLHAFLALPPEKQEQLRRLDQQLNEQTAAVHARLQPGSASRQVCGRNPWEEGFAAQRK